VKVRFPFLGEREIREDDKEPGHFLWLSSFGWHDCSRSEDKLSQDFVKNVNDDEADT